MIFNHPKLIENILEASRLGQTECLVFDGYTLCPAPEADNIQHGHISAVVVKVWTRHFSTEAWVTPENHVYWAYGYIGSWEGGGGDSTWKWTTVLSAIPDMTSDENLAAIIPAPRCNCRWEVFEVELGDLYYGEFPLMVAWAYVLL